MKTTQVLKIYDALLIEKMPKGGYIIKTHERTEGMFNPTLKACSSLSEALQFIRENIK